jgi:hypothetical protein
LIVTSSTPGFGSVTNSVSKRRVVKAAARDSIDPRISLIFVPRFYAVAIEMA